MAFDAAARNDIIGHRALIRRIVSVQGASIWGTRPVRLPVSPAVLLYVLVPLVLLALPLGLFRVAVGPGTSLVLSLYFWSATVMVGWLAAALGSFILYRLCARLRPPLWAIVLFGPLLIGLVLREPIIEILSLTNMLHVGLPITPATSITFTWAFAQKFLLNLAPGTTTWIATNYFFDRVLDIPRYRYPDPVAHDELVAEAPAVAPAVSPMPLLIERLPPAERGELIALRAYDHYVRIYTDTSAPLTLARLRDAIEMAHPISGMQVHRSNWVADRAVKDFRRTGHTGILYLTNGLEVPVSRSYCRDVEQRVKALSHTRPENT